MQKSDDFRLEKCKRKPIFGWKNVIFPFIILIREINMLSRNITKDIQKWYLNSSTGLLIDGARQIGKTTIIEDFLVKNNIDFIELNLLENKLALEAFNTTINAKDLLFRLSSLFNKELIENRTVIFIDEIQEADDAITPIKFLVQNTKFRFIFSGSLLGVKMQDIQSVPVGFLTVLQMYPMDFGEFCKAVGVSDKTMSYLNECFEKKKPIDEIIHKQMLNLFKTYIIVGGMPKAVSEFVKTNDMTKVNRVLESIDFGYRQDITKYQKSNKLLIQDIYNLIPSELNAQNKRFILKNLNEKARFYQYETSFTWLKNSGVGLFVHNVDNPIYPLLASKERTLFKLFLCDVGLLTYKLYNGNQISILNGDSDLNNGAVYEAVVAQELKTHGFELYYHNDKKRGEIDFLIEKDNTVVPLEVKSGKDYKRHSALAQLMANSAFHYREGIVLCNGNLAVEKKTIYLPIYMIDFIQNTKEDGQRLVHLDISSLI